MIKRYLLEFKWFVFRVLVAAYLCKKVRSFDMKFAWPYSDNFDNYFDDVKWLSMISDVKYAVAEDISYWSE